MRQRTRVRKASRWPEALEDHLSAKRAFESRVSMNSVFRVDSKSSID
jgi:hypothetical protein